MKFTIDNLDYASALDSQHPPRIVRRLNRPTELRAFLHAAHTQFVVPAQGARVLLTRNNGSSVFTGYVIAAPEYEYLGWSERGPVYRYVLRCGSDEALTATKTLPARADFVQRSAGEIVAKLANDALPGVFDTSGCEDVAV